MVLLQRRAIVRLGITQVLGERVVLRQDALVSCSSTILDEALTTPYRR
jgi:hypothetical protein